MHAAAHPVRRFGWRVSADVPSGGVPRGMPVVASGHGPRPLRVWASFDRREAAERSGPIRAEMGGAAVGSGAHVPDTVSCAVGPAGNRNPRTVAAIRFATGICRRPMPLSHPGIRASASVAGAPTALR